jgi:hypothetical protein
MREEDGIARIPTFNDLVESDLDAVAKKNLT